MNEEPGDLTDYDCPLCKNRGFFYRVMDNGERYTEDCSCMETRRNMRYLKESGLADLLGRYTFDNWECSKKWQRGVANMAREYVEDPNGWFFLCGRPGTGKTHICTAICGELMKKGYRTRYLLWRDFSVQAKAVVNDEETYQNLIRPYKAAKVLYIDDFFKTGKGQDPTVGDTNLAFELLNSRYNDDSKITLLSSELTADRILEIDEALGSRICQRAKNFYADLSEKENYRLM